MSVIEGSDGTSKMEYEFAHMHRALLLRKLGLGGKAPKKPEDAPLEELLD